jgi:hypothetical protein
MELAHRITEVVTISAQVPLNSAVDGRVSTSVHWCGYLNPKPHFRWDRVRPTEWAALPPCVSSATLRLHSLLRTQGSLLCRLVDVLQRDPRAQKEIPSVAPCVAPSLDDGACISQQGDTHEVESPRPKHATVLPVRSPISSALTLSQAVPGVASSSARVSSPKS